MRNMLKQAYNSENYFYLNPIEVTSPEQFVPTFLAYLINIDNERHDRIVFRQRTDISLWLPPNTTNHDGYATSRDQHKRALIKQALMKQLNVDYPKRYTMPIPKQSMMTDYAMHSFNAVSSSNYASMCFAGNMDYYTAQTRYFGLPGTLAYVHGVVNNVSMPNNYYRSYNYVVNAVFMDNLVPLSIMLVKAKHIPIMRACAYLDRPMEPLPFGDLKILEGTPPDTDSRAFMQNSYLECQLGAFITANGIRPETCSKEYMKSFLFGPTPVVSKSDILEKARRLNRGEEKLLPINV